MKGFTLIETILYIALYGFIITSAYAAAFTISKSMQHAQTYAYLEYEGDFLLQKIAFLYQTTDQSTEAVSSLLTSDLLVTDSSIHQDTQSIPSPLMIEFTLSASTSDDMVLQNNFSETLYPSS